MKPVKLFEITHNELCRLIHYDSSTGEMRRLVRRGKYPAGQLVGHMSTSGNGVVTSMVRINNRTYSTRRLVWFYMTGRWPSNPVKHVRRHPWDLTWDMLRCAAEDKDELPPDFVTGWCARSTHPMTKSQLLSEDARLGYTWRNYDRWGLDDGYEQRQGVG